MPTKPDPPEDRPSPRVAVFCEQGHPEADFISGVSRFTRTLFRYAEERGLPLDVFAYHVEASVVKRRGVRYHGIRPKTPVTFHGLDVDPWDVMPVRNRRLTGPALERGDYDVVFATAPGIGTQARIVARKLGVPLVLLFTTDLPDYAAELVEAKVPGAMGRWLMKPARAAAWRYLRWLYDRSGTRLVLVPTAAVRDLLLSRADARVELLGRGSDTLPFEHAADLAGHPDPPTMLFVGRLDIGQKNLDVLCRAVREIPEARLVLVGDGDDEQALREALGEEIVEGRVELMGRIEDHDRLMNAYLSADLFVFPSLFDTLGQVVVEAQAAGLPVVVMDAGGPPELVEGGRSGFIARDTGEFIALCRRLVEDRDLRVRMGRRAREHALALPSWDDVMDRLYDYFREVSSAAEAPPPTPAATS